MKSLAVVLAASGLAATQATLPNPTGGGNQIECPRANAQFCAGASLETDIIIRCNNASVGQPGRCTDNLAGQPPLGVNPAFCYQSSETAGDAACAKNCVVYLEGPDPSSFTLPASECTPTPIPSKNATTTTTPPFVTNNSTITIPTETGSATRTPVGPTGTQGGGGGGGGGGNGGGGGGGQGGGGQTGGGGGGGETSVPTAAAAFHGVGALAIAGAFAAFVF